MDDQNQTQTAEQETADQSAAPVITFADPSKRIATIDLDYPLVIDGQRLDSVVIKRPTFQDVEDFMRRVELRRKSHPLATLYFPMYFDTEGHALADAVINAFDDGDAVRINEVVTDFLPPRFRAKPRK